MPQFPPSAEIILDVLSKAGAVFFRFDPFSGLTFLSAGQGGLLGYSRDELLRDPEIGKRVVDPAYQGRLDQIGSSFYVATGEAIRISLPLRTKFGDRVWIEARLVPEIGHHGTITGFLGIALDAPTEEGADEEIAVPETVPE